MRGASSNDGVERSGSTFGPMSHRSRIPAEPASTTGRVKSNMPNGASPSREAISATSRLVEVPIVVAMPPMLVANPTGISTPVTDVCVRRQTATSTGSTMATSGVLFMNMLAAATPNSVASSPRRGLRAQKLPSRRATTCSAPVTSSALEQTSRATTVTRAGLPKPARKPTGFTGPSGPV